MLKVKLYGYEFVVSKGPDRVAQIDAIIATIHRMSAIQNMSIEDCACKLSKKKGDMVPVLMPDQEFPQGYYVEDVPMFERPGLGRPAEFNRDG